MLYCHYTYNRRKLVKNMKTVTKVEKEKLTLSLNVGTKSDLSELAKKYGMTMSGLIHFLVQRLKEREDLFK